MRTNEQKLELFADLVEPVAAILSDKSVALAVKEDGLAAGIRVAVKQHPSQIVEILARVADADPAKYQIDGVSLFFRLFAMFNRPDIDVNGLFTSQAQSFGGASFGPATENITDGAN